MSLTSDQKTIYNRPPSGWLSVNLGEVWEYRELLFFLVWRDLRVRYKQTAIGIAWALIQPVLTMVIFTIVFGNFVQVPSEGVPYSLFVFAALLPWNYFSQAINRSSEGLVGNTNLVSKVYFPRLIIPLASVIAPLADFALAFLVQLGLMFWYGYHITWRLLLIPVLMVFVMILASGVSLWLSALNVRYRDVRFVVPFMIQAWLYASPIAYGTSLVPENFRLLYSINPVAGVVEGFRWALLGSGSLDLTVMAVGAVITFIILVGGLIFFSNLENSFADVI